MLGFIIVGYVPLTKAYPVGEAMVHCLDWYIMTPVSLVPLNSSVHEYHEFSRSLVQNYPSSFLGQRTE